VTCLGGYCGDLPCIAREGYFVVINTILQKNGMSLNGKEPKDDLEMKCK
jgi:hypothetical protein